MNMINRQKKTRIIILATMVMIFGEVKNGTACLNFDRKFVTVSRKGEENRLNKKTKRRIVMTKGSRIARPAKNDFFIQFLHFFVAKEHCQGELLLRRKQHI